MGNYRWHLEDPKRIVLVSALLNDLSCQAGTERGLSAWYVLLGLDLNLKLGKGVDAREICEILDQSNRVKAAYRVVK